MKQWIIYLSFLFLAPAASSQDTTHNFLRFYADNDAFIPTSNATDWGYTSGIRIDLFYTASNKQDIFSWFNKLAGPDRITTKGWGLKQMIIAPQKTSLAVPDRNDYPYAGALIGIHTIHSANGTKKLNLQSEWIAGILGPPSLGEQTHRFFHRLIKDPPPMGWDHQLPTDLLLNYNISAEKLLKSTRFGNLIGIGQVRSGTMNDDISARLRLQLFNREDHFNGLTKQVFDEKGKLLSLWVEVSGNMVLYNSLLQGGLFNRRSPVHDKQSPFGTDRKMQHFTASAEIFFLVSIKKFAISAQLKAITPELKGYDPHKFGNLSLYIFL